MIFWSLKNANEYLARFCGNLTLCRYVIRIEQIWMYYITSRCISVYETYRHCHRRRYSGRIAHFEATVRNLRYVSGIPEFLTQRQTRISAICAIFYSFICLDSLSIVYDNNTNKKKKNCSFCKKRKRVPKNIN